MKKFCFIDLETTGLVPEDGGILEFAMIITDNKLNELEVYETVIHQSQYTLDGMNNWALEAHTNSGLIAQVKDSHTLTKDVEIKVLDILARHFSGPEKPLIGGSSVHFDKMWIAAKMPNLNKRLHYRIIDVTSFMEAIKIYHGVIPTRKHVAHRVLADIRDSIMYLKEHMERFK